MKDEQNQAGWNPDPDPQLKGREPRPFNRPSFNEALVQLYPNINISLVIFVSLFLSTKVAQQLQQQTGATKAANYWLTVWLPVDHLGENEGFCPSGRFFLADSFSFHHSTETWGSGRCGGFKGCHLIKCYCYWEPVTWTWDFCEWAERPFHLSASWWNGASPRQSFILPQSLESYSFKPC